MSKGRFVIIKTHSLGEQGYLAVFEHSRQYTFMPDMVRRFDTRAEAEKAIKYTSDFEAVVEPAKGSKYA